MKVTSLPDAEPRPRKVAVGTFDGVHLGHREVIRGNDTVLTFDPHPLSVVAPQALPKLLDSPAIKRDLIAGLGVDELVTIPFDREFASKSADEFVEEVLIEQARRDARVGRARTSASARARRATRTCCGRDSEFETRVVPLVEVEDETVSSTHIRGLVAAGDVERAARFLGAPFMLEGEVVGGDRRGRELGFPTANIVPGESHRASRPRRLRAWAHGHMAAVNVGVRPTFETGRGLLVEAYLIDFDADLYGQTLRIAFARRLRGERRFETAEALVEQMERDVEDARRVLVG